MKRSADFESVTVSGWPHMHGGWGARKLRKKLRRRARNIVSRRRLQLSPLILSTNYITGAMPIKCELAHKSAIQCRAGPRIYSDAENCSAAYQNDNECQWEPYTHDAKNRESNFKKQGSIGLHATNRHVATPTSPRGPFARRPRMNNQKSSSG
jgi:hypothetical protein